MSYCFRIRCNLEKRVHIDSPEKELSIDDPLEGREIVLKASGADSLSDAQCVVLLGRPYDSAENAMSAAERWLGILQKGMAHINLGANFGARGHRGAFTHHGLSMLEAEMEQRVLNDVHGILVFECDPAPRFASMSADIRVGRPAARLIEAIEKAASIGAVMSETEQLAYDLYAASFSESSADARFVMLMMALETLIVPEPRAEAIQAHVEDLIQITSESGLPENEIASIEGSLKWLMAESIGQAGRKLARRLGNRAYMDGAESSSEFFTTCYSLRSDLVHGRNPRSSRDAVDARAANLELFVADLLSLELK
jgi:hypothetical protein